MGAQSSKSQNWRAGTTLEFTDEGVTKLLFAINKLAKTKFDDDKELDLRILCFGPTGCGKSSFCNGIKTALSQMEVVSRFFGTAATEEASFSKGFTFWKWKNIYLVDMAGVCEDEAIEEESVKKILEGQVPLKSKLSDDLKADAEATAGKTKAYFCVVLVLKAGLEIPHHTKRLIDIAVRQAGQRSLAYHLVLTHLDTVERQFEETKNLDKILTSVVVKEKVDEARKQIGIPPNSVSFVRNYVNETESDIKSNVLFLDTFHHIVSVAVEQAEKEYMKGHFE